MSQVCEPVSCQKSSTNTSQIIKQILHVATDTDMGPHITPEGVQSMPFAVMLSLLNFIRIPKNQVNIRELNISPITTFC